MAGLDTYVGENLTVAFSMLGTDGAAKDMTVSGRSLTCNLTKSDASTPAVTLSPTWVSQAGGTCTFAFTQAAIAALALGSYVLEVWYTATTDSERQLVGRVTGIKILASQGGAPP